MPLNRCTNVFYKGDYPVTQAFYTLQQITQRYNTIVLIRNTALFDGYPLSMLMVIYLKHDNLIFGKCPIKWRQRPDMTIAVDLDVKPQFK